MRIALVALMLLMPSLVWGQFVEAINVTGPYGGYTVKLECYSGVVEKAECAGISGTPTPHPPPYLPDAPTPYGHYTYLTSIKTYIRVRLLPLYVNHTLTNSYGRIDLGYAANDFKRWDETSICAAAGVPTNWFDVSNPYRWYSSNNWGSAAAVINKMRWTTVAAEPYTNARKYIPALYPNDTDCGTARTNQMDNWINEPGQWGTYYSPGGGRTRYEIFAFHKPTGGGWDFDGQRRTVSLEASGMWSNTAHTADLYAQALATNIYHDFYSNVFHDADVFGIPENHFGFIEESQGGTVATNLRQTDWLSFHPKYYYLNGLNPVVQIPVLCSDPAFYTPGMALDSERFLLRWDTDAADGMQWIYD